MIINEFSTNVNDRFSNDSSFLLNDYNLSGIGIVGSSGKWATLIRPNICVSANHWYPGTGSVVTFFETNDPNGNQQERTIGSTFRAGSTSDLRICVLTEALPSSYVPFPFVRLRCHNSFFQEYGYVCGRSPSSLSTVNDVAVGHNQIISSSQLFSSYVKFIYTSTASGGDANECYLQTGDSGAPVFIVKNERLMLVAVNSVIYDDGQTFGCEFLGRYSYEIQQIIRENK